jgi:hypothetical protein
MKADLNPERKVTVLDVEEHRYIFDLTNIVSENVVGSEAALREASQMLATVVTLKPIVDSEYAKTSGKTYALFWDEGTVNIVPGKKKTKEDYAHWKHTQPEYVAALKARDYIASLTDKLTYNYIPRLRDLTDSTKSAERNARAGENAQPALPRVPVSPPAPFGPPTSPGAR